MTLPTMGTGTFGSGNVGRPKVQIGPEIGGGGASDGTPYEWRATISWAGGAVTYTDKLLDDGIQTGEVPLVQEWGEIVRSATGVTTYDTTRLVLVNAPDPDTAAQVWDEWDAANPPEGVAVTIDVYVNTAWVSVFSGYIAEVPRADMALVELILSTRDDILDRDLLPVLDRTTYPNLPDSSVGRPEPLALGIFTNGEAILVDDDQVTVLSTSLLAADTTVEAEDVSAFPATGTVRIDDEKMTYTGVDTVSTPNQFTGVTRGVSGTTATSHASGVPIVEVGTLLFLVSCDNLSQDPINLRLVDPDGIERSIPDDISVVIDAASKPSTIQLSEQPILPSATVPATTLFKFIDLDTVDSESSGTGNTSVGFADADVEAMCGLTEGYTETNGVVLSATDATQQKACGYRTAAIDLPSGATIERAYLVVESYLDSGNPDVTTKLNGGIDATSTADILVDAVDSFAPGGSVFIEEEEIGYTGTTDVPSPRLQGISRGINAAGSAAHADDALVVQSAVVASFKPSGGSLTVAAIDAEGYIRRKTDTPQNVMEDTGLLTISKGFEDEHSHVVSGSHTHATDTAHAHKAPTVIEWVPSIILAAKPDTTSATYPACSVVLTNKAQEAVPSEYGNVVDDNLSTYEHLAYNPVGFYGWRQFWFRGSANGASPNDTRKVTSIEFIVATNLGAFAGQSPPGEITLSWEANVGLGICQIKQTKNPSVSGRFRFQISTSSNPGQPGSTFPGDVFDHTFTLPTLPQDYVNNPGIRIDSFTVDTSGDNLTVADFVDKDYGGTDKYVSLFHYASDLRVHNIKFRLTLEEDTSNESITDPIDTVAWPDTDTATPLKTSRLSWFDITDRVSTVSDLIGARCQVRHLQYSPYVTDVTILRLFLALEVSGVTLQGDYVLPKRLIYDAPKATSGNPVNWLRNVFTNTRLLNLASSAYDDAALTVAQNKVTGNAGGVVYDQVRAPELLQAICDQHRLTPWWTRGGKFTVTYQDDRDDIAGTTPAWNITDNNVVRTEAGIPRERAPIDQLRNDVIIRTALDPVSGEYQVVATASDATSQAAYGMTKTHEEKDGLIHSSVAAQDLADHRIDYGKDLADRITVDAYLSDVTALLDPTAIIGSEHSSITGTSFVVERVVLRPGSMTRGMPDLVQVRAVDRTPNP